MKRALSLTAFSLLLAATSASAAPAQAIVCPPEVADAEKLLTTITASRPPRSLASARAQDVQAPRAQDVQAPRAQDVQAPRTQDVQAPRTQDVQAPRAKKPAPNARASTLDSAKRLVREAQAACKSGDGARSAANARAALELLNYLR